MDLNNQNEGPSMADLGAILAHEIKNPMNSIMINIEVLKQSLTDKSSDTREGQNGKIRKYVDIIEGELVRLNKVLTGFLDFANPSKSAWIRFKLNPIIQSLMDLMSLEFEQKKIQIELDLASDLPAMTGNPDQIKQALVNLVLNSFQSFTQGGKIGVRTWATEQDIRVKISDNGAGIKPENLAQVFEPRFTTKSSGSGLGLTVVRKIMQEHRGEISLESSLESGTHFTLIFPRNEN